MKRKLPSRRNKKKEDFCEHFLYWIDCIICSGNGSEDVRYCKKCKENVFHRSRRCRRCKTYNDESEVLYKL